MTTDRPKILIFIEGGIVQSVFCTHKLDIEVEIFDADNLEDNDPEQIDNYRNRFFKSGDIVRDEYGFIEVNPEIYPYRLDEADEES